MSLRARADPLARRFGHYTAYTLRGEKVGTAPEYLTVSDVRECLESRGYEPSPSLGPIPLEAAKRHPETGETHDLALRRVAGAGDGRHAAAIHADEPAHCQFHVHGFDTRHGVELHSHFEWRPDLTGLTGESSPRETYHRLRSHYRPGSYGGGAYLKRVHDENVSMLVKTSEEKSR